LTPILAWLVPATLAWGVLAFGAVYPWAYWPLLIVASAIGLWGIAAAGLDRAGRDRAGLKARVTLAAWPAGGLAAVALAISLQLVPLPRSLVVSASPATDAFLRQHDLVYATAAADADESTAGRASHPLSLRPDSTRRALAFAAAFGLLLIGLAAPLSMAAGGVQRLADTITVLAVVVALIAIIQAATVTAGEVYGFWTPELAGGIFGPFVNKNHFAGWMVMALSVTIGLCCGRIARGMRGVKPDWRNRMLWFASPDANRLILTAFAALVMGLALVMSLSRSGIACFAIAIILSAFMVTRRQATSSKRAVAAGYLAFVLIVAVGWAGVDAVAKRFTAASWDDIGGRLGAWHDTLRIAKDFPLTGIGINTFGEAMLDYQTKYLDKHFGEAHNDWLQLVAEGGLLVGLPILVTLILFIREVRRRFREAQDDTMSYWLRIGAVTGLLAIALQEVVDFSLQIPGNALLFVVLAAIAIRRAPPRRVEGAPS